MKLKIFKVEEIKNVTDVCNISNKLNILFYCYFKQNGMKDKENFILPKRILKQ